MEILSNWQNLVVRPLEDMLFEVMSFIPNLLKVILIFLAGWFVAKFFKFLLTKFFARINFDSLVEKIGVSAIFKADNGKASPGKIVSSAIYWLIIFVVVIMAFNQLKMYKTSYLLEDVISYVVTILKVSIILILGMFLSMGCSRVILLIAKKVNTPRPEIQASIVRTGIIIFTFIICLVRLGLPQEILLTIVGVGFVTICLTFIVAFGVGGQVWAAKFLDKIFQPGSQKQK